MKLYLITSDVVGWDTFGSAVVAAESEDDARTIHPGGMLRIPLVKDEDKKYMDDWTNDPSEVHVLYIGKAAMEINSPQVICASFHSY